MKHVKNAHMGQHLLVEVYNVPFEKLNDAEKIEKTMVRAVETEGFTVLNTFTHQFEPYGVTTLVSLAERVCSNRYFHLRKQKSTQCSMVDT